MATKDTEDGWTVVTKPTVATQSSASDDGWTVITPAKKEPVAAAKPTSDWTIIAPAKKTEGPIAFDQLYKDPENFNKIQAYALARYGEKEKFDPNKETQEDYVKRWASAMRMNRDNLLSGGQELAYIANAKREDVLKAKAAYDLFDNTASYFSSEGQKGVKPILDVLGNIASDPINLISAGVGSLAKSTFTKAAAEQGIQAAVKSRLGSLAAVPAVEGLGAAAQNVTGQKIELSTDKAKLDRLKELMPRLTPDQIDKVQPEITALEEKVKAGVSGTEAAIAGGIGALTGTLETGSILAAGKAAKVLQGESKATTGTLQDILDAKRSAMAKTEPKVEVKATTDPTMKSLEDAYDIFEGQKLLAKEGSPTAIAQMQIRTDINKKASLIAQDIWKDMPHLAPQGEEKVGDAIKRTLSDVDTINDEQFMKSLSAADVTPEEFSKMFRASVGDAGRTLQSLSVVKRLENKMRSIDPAAAKELDKMYGERNALTSAFTGLRDLGMRVDRELKALMVSQLSTTIRNGFSGMAVVTFGTASEAIESSLYRLGKTASELASGKPVTGSFTGGLKGVYDDALRTVYYLRRSDLSSDTADELLKGTPSLLRLISKTAGETEANNLSRPAQLANTLNVAQDSFFRKAIFTSSVEKQLSRVGIDMYDVLAQNKQIPFDVLRNATDEALTATFSKMPTKGPMFHAVKFVEELGPIGSTVIPFPRFMANAMSWTYKHSPMGMFSGAADIAKGSLLLKQGSEEGQRYLTQGLEKTSKGAVGVSAIYAAYKYRQEHQDTNWYDIENPDRSTVDARALFPLAPFLALGDYLVKLQNGRTDEFKTKEFIEALTGFKAPAGTTSWLGDKFSEAMSGMQTGEGMAEQKVSTFFGEWVGEYFGRVLVPVQQLSDIIGAIDRDETLPRDAYQIKPGEEGFTSSATQQLMKRIPIVKQELPVYQPATREEAAYNDSGVLKMLTGIAIKGHPDSIENEITRLHIQPNKIFTSTGDKIVDAEARKVMAPLLLQTFDTVSNTDYYKQASQDMQKIMLTNTLNYAQKTAKEIATNQSLADAFKSGEQPRIFAIKYASLPAEVRRATAEMYKQQTGKDLNETKAYMEALTYASVIKELPGLAKGGFVKMAGGGVAAKVAGDLLQIGAKAAKKDILQEVEEMVLKNEASGIVPKIAKTAAQTDKLLEMPAEASKTVSKAINPVEPMPMPTEPKAAAVSGEKAVVAPVQETPAAFSDYQMQEAEKILKGKMGSQYQLDAYKKAYPEEYQNSINQLASEIEPAAKPVTSETVAPVAKEATPELAAQDEALAKAAQAEKDKVLTTVSNLNKPKFGSGETTRKATLSNIKDIRAGAYDVLRNDTAFSDIDDDVIAVAQGDWRLKNKSELNLADPEEMQKFTKMVGDYQTRYNNLQEQYQDYPPIRLYHGSTSKRTPEKLRRGFLDPQHVTDRKHMELNVGATSFTRDLRLNYGEDAFGGGVPENVSYTEMSRADYEFRKIDMSLAEYRKRDMNVIAQSITGSPTTARPLSLPRSLGYKESEAAFVESEKLVIKADEQGIDKQFGIARSQEKVYNKLFNTMQSSVKGLANETSPIKAVTKANEVYRNIKMLLTNEFRETGGKKATEKGYAAIPMSSQTTEKRLGTISRSMFLDIDKSIDLVSSTLEKSAPEKATALRQLQSNLKVLSKTYDPEKVDIATENAILKDRIKAVNNIRDLVGGGMKKDGKRIGLAKGGLASRR